MQTHFITYKKSKICFGLAGYGPRLMLCLHGFGEDRNIFVALENELGKEYTLFCIDFPFHGETLWQEDLLLKPGDLLQLIENIFEKTGFTPLSKFSLLAYSLGGRVAMHLLQLVPERIERMVLLAPDGLRINFWYRLGTQTKLGNKLFYRTMYNPAWFFYMANFSHKAGLLNKSIIKFVHYYLDDKEARLLLYKRWTTLRKFKPNNALVKQIIAERKIPVRFVFGSHDRIILEKRSKLFKKDTANVKVEVIQTGHNLLKEKYVPDIVRQFSE